MRRISCMKTTTAPFLLLFLFFLLASALHAEERLIPLDGFFLTVPVTDAPNMRGMEVKVRVRRNKLEPQGSTSIGVSCPSLNSDDQTLEPDEVAAFMEACAAALKDQEYRKEIQRMNFKTVYEVATVKGCKRVRISRGAEAFMIPEEGARLQEALARAAAAEAWYKMLLTAHTLPEKTAEAHPPKSTGCRLQSTLGRVHAEGLEYEVTLQRAGYARRQPYRVVHKMLHIARGGKKTFIRVISGEWVKPMMEQVALALEAVEKKESFVFESPVDGDGNKYSVTANLATQQADMVADTFGGNGKRVPEQCSFAVAQLAEIRAVAVQCAAREKWFAEHEAWFFEWP